MPSALPHIQGPADFAAAFDVSRETIARLTAYEALLRQWQKAVNLVAPGTLEDIWHRHFADSAQLLALAPHARSWLDLGSGAGFPGLVIAILMAEKAAPTPSPRLRGEGRGEGHPNPLPTKVWGEGTPQERGEGMRRQPRVTLIESDTRKAAFLREVVRQTGIAARVAVDILSIRIEKAATQPNFAPPEVISARALAPLERLLALAAPHFAPSTVGLFLKGKGVAAELAAAERAWKFDVELVPSMTERDGRIAVIRHLVPEPKAKPKDRNP